jgi:hypothetical protein
MSPVSSFALLLLHDVSTQYADFADVATMFLAAIFVMEFIGPIAVQFGLKLAGETAPDDDVGTTTGRHVARIPGPEGSR